MMGRTHMAIGIAVALPVIKKRVYIYYNFPGKSI